MDQLDCVVIGVNRTCLFAVFRNFTPGGLGKFNAGDTVDTSGHNRAELYVSWREGRARSPLWAGVDCAGSGGH